VAGCRTSSDVGRAGTDVDPAALNGQVVASLSGLQRTIDDYDSLARKELVEDKREKALR
jgi:golgi SNAP receptor complex member 2